LNTALGHSFWPGFRATNNAKRDILLLQSDNEVLKAKITLEELASKKKKKKMAKRITW